MDNTYYITLSRQIGLFNKMDVIASNVANAETDGFRGQMMLFAAHETDGGQGRNIAYTHDIATVDNHEQGNIKATGRPLDVAINGDGMFAVQTPLGVRYTRAGNFTLDSNNQLITDRGYNVLDDAQGNITLAENDRDILISREGVISAVTEGGEREDRGTIGVFLFDDKSTLERKGNGLYEAKEGAQPRTGIGAEDYYIGQGMLEGSNVNSIAQMTDMIRTSRAVGSTARILSDMHDLERKAISIISKQG